MCCLRMEIFLSDLSFLRIEVMVWVLFVEKLLCFRWLWILLGVVLIFRIWLVGSRWFNMNLMVFCLFVVKLLISVVYVVGVSLWSFFIDLWVRWFLDFLMWFGLCVNVLFELWMVIDMWLFVVFCVIVLNYFNLLIVFIV